MSNNVLFCGKYKQSILKFLVPEKVKYHVAKAYTPKRKAMKFLTVIEEGLAT